MKLTECNVLELYVGTVFRFKGTYPFTEDHVDFMLCDYPNCSENHIPFALYCVSGYCAGHLEYIFPSDAKSDTSRSISTKWLIEYWEKKVYAECSADEVEVII